MNEALSISNLSIEFFQGESTATAVRVQSLTVRSGEILGLVGESGSGKSLTALACLGLEPAESQVTGSVLVGGREISEVSEATRAGLRGRRIAMIFQNPMTALNPFFTIGSQMTGVVRQHFSVSKQEARQRAATALGQAGLGEVVLGRYPHQMSGGQLQRAMIAMAIACQPEVLIADEPTTALDVTVQEKILNLLRTLADQGMGILLITHDLGVVAQVADRVAVMYSGSIVEFGDLRSVFERTAHPYTRGLMQSSPVMGMGRQKLHAIPGVVPDFRRRPSGCSFRERCSHAQSICASEAVPGVELTPQHAVNCHCPVTTEIKG